MIAFPSAKINIGLDVLERRSDGFHSIRSIFYPIPLFDVLEIVRDDALEGATLSLSGIEVDGETQNNLVHKAYQLLAQDYKLGGVRMHLRKGIPIGAGLGGGSSDGTSALLLINALFDLNLDPSELHAKAALLGSDCPFFIESSPMLVQGRGERMQAHNLNLTGKYMTLVMPPFGVSTAEAYGSVVPQMKTDELSGLSATPMQFWKRMAVNQFESGSLEAYEKVREIKGSLLESGAVYASMTGSGAAVFGISPFPLHFSSPIPGCKIYQLKL